MIKKLNVHIVIIFSILNFVNILLPNFQKIRTSKNVTIFKKKKDLKITIYIHGTHISKHLNRFIKLPYDLTKISDIPDTVFYKSLMHSLIKADPIEIPMDSFYIFGWTGQLCPNERLKAAQDLHNSLQKLILKNSKYNCKITIIAHSHGGNVALNLANIANTSKLKNDNDYHFKIDRLILLGTPVQQTTKQLVKSPLFSKVYNIYSSLDAIQLIDIQKFHKKNEDKKVPIFSERQFDICPNLKQTKIKINNRAIFHIEFMLDNFLSILPHLIKQMDKLDSNKNNYLIKVNLKNKIFETMDQCKKANSLMENKKKHCDNIIIFIHGSHNGSSKLFVKYVDEINKLSHISELNEHHHHPYLIAKNFCRSQDDFNSFYAFGWSGITNPEERYKAAQVLYNEIKNLMCKYENKPKLTIITHSHGGNVFLNLAKIVNEQNPEFEIDTAILLACPVQEHTKNLVKSCIFKKIYHIYSSLDTFQIMDPQRLHLVNRNKKGIPFFSQRRFDPNPNLRQGKIKINNRSLFHVEFILETFLQVLPEIMKEMDAKKSDGRDLIKVKRI